MPWTNPSQLVLYHGTVDLYMASIAHGIDVTIGGISKDFSRGFYTTTYFAQAATHARTLRHRLHPKGARRAVVGVFTVTRDMISSLTSMAFVYPTNDFWDLIDWCRSNHPGHHAGGYYDVVYGPVTQDYRRRTVHDEYDQVSFHNAATVGVLGVPQWSIVV